LRNRLSSASVLVAVIFSMALMGCTPMSVPTPYQSYVKPVGGYSDKQIADEVYRVVFEGNQTTPLPTAYAYSIYRAAEIARDHDAPYFEVVEGFQDRKPEDDGPNFSRVEPQDQGTKALAGTGYRLPPDVDAGHTVYVSEGDFSDGWSIHKTIYYVPILVPGPRPEWYRSALLIRLLKEKPTDKDKAYHVFETTRILTVLGPRLKRPKPEAAKDANT